ncbi:MAG: LacI family DNA-binding transcriptional regulator [Trueperaceae bacterium]|nr:MAG: LacI family DNA-binding transcriptional regulator [Trueperaceae bacterium]
MTIYDVSRAAGVSYSTVSRVLNGFEHVKDSTRSRVLRVAEELGYVANQKARSLAGGKSRVIGLLVPVLDNGYISEIARGVDEALARSGYDLMLYTTHRVKSTEMMYAKAIASGLSEGLLLLVPKVPAHYLELLRAQNFPHVLIDQQDEANRSATVETTNRQGAHDATRHLLSLGHRRIAFVSGSPELSPARERLDGYRKALGEAGIAFEPELVAEGDFQTEGGRSAALELLSLRKPPSAIFAANDLSAFGVMDAVRSVGLAIPDDISVVGFDDIPQASITYPKLTTVRQPLTEMGRVAVTLLLEQLHSPGSELESVVLKTELVNRESCGAID